MVQGMGKNIGKGIVIVVIIVAVLAVMLAAPIVGLVYEYTARSAANIPFWDWLTILYTGILMTSGVGIYWLGREARFF